MPLLSAPGERFAYSNAGYHLLGFIAKRAGGKFFGDQLEERIFTPLGMTSAGVISETDIVPGRAAGYERIDGKLQNQRWVAPSLNRTADGTIALSARDLARWSMALDGDAILDARAKQASWTPARLNDGSSGPYGLGWYVGSQNGHRVVQHGGAWQGFKAALQRYPDERLTVVVLANSAAARQGKIADLVAAHYVPALATPRSPAIADLDPAGTARARKAMEELLAGRIPDGLSASERGRYNQRWVTQIRRVPRFRSAACGGGAGPRQRSERQAGALPLPVRERDRPGGGAPGLRRPDRTPGDFAGVISPDGQSKNGSATRSGTPRPDAGSRSGNAAGWANPGSAAAPGTSRYGGHRPVPCR